MYCYFRMGGLNHYPVEWITARGDLLLYNIHIIRTLVQMFMFMILLYLRTKKVALVFFI